MAWEFFTGQYNIRTHEISGCKPGGLVWLHERGHQIMEERYNFGFWMGVVVAVCGVLGLWGLLVMRRVYPVLLWLSVAVYAGQELIPWCYALAVWLSRPKKRIQ